MTSPRLEVPAHRAPPLRQLLDRLLRAERVALTTHVNADGDGAGSEAALAAWLIARGKHVRIVNPTPFPATFLYLVPDRDVIADATTAAGPNALSESELLVVLDTSEPARLSRVAPALKQMDVVVVDHHPPSDASIEAPGLQDPTACATGELLYDLLLLADGREQTHGWPAQTPEGLYTAIVTDTGSFRFSNTTPRAHEIAGDLIRRGVDPELMYRRIYGTVPLYRVRLLSRALDHLDIDPELPMAWITIPPGTLQELGGTSEDLDGVIEHARSLEGMQVALLFRETSDGSTKVSWRSNGALDVNVLARAFGGGGHIKAAGALIPERLDKARSRVLAATGDALRALVAADAHG